MDNDSNSLDELYPPWTGPAIMLVDLDAFFASVEQLDHPGWRGKPVIVGGNPTKRGVVSTASYEARAFGVHSAMPSSTARRLCPQAVWTAGHFDRYRQMSNAVIDILYAETPFVQQVSIDEAFVDVSPTRHNREHPLLIAQRIQQKVADLGVTCSIGLGTTKSVAKVASDRDKPAGLTVVYPGREQAFLAPLPLSVMSGIGVVAQQRLARFAIRTLGDVAQADESILRGVFGKNADMMRKRLLGEDESFVSTEKAVKSVSSEMSFAEDLVDVRRVEGAIATMAAKTCRRLRKQGRKGVTVMLKIRYADLKIRTAQKRAAEPLDDEYEVTAMAKDLLGTIWAPGMPLRLVGVAVSGFDKRKGPAQPSLFDTRVLNEQDVNMNTGEAGKRRELMRATDKIRDRFGEGAVRYGRERASEDSSTGTGAKNPEDYLSDDRSQK